MTQKIASKLDNKLTSITSVHSEHAKFAIILIDKQPFGIPVQIVHDVLVAQDIAKIPLAPPEIRGSLNLRGRIVTAIDVRHKLSVPSLQTKNYMCVVVEHKGDFYSLIVDDVGEVLELSSDQFENNPPTMDARWKQYANGIYRLDQSLVIVLDIPKILNISH
jgi:purine-binding chemotaxis protein CheW